MIELMILGFLSEAVGGRLHGYELRRRMEQLHGHARTVSDGTLYPAIRRLREAGAVTAQDEPGRAGAGRSTLHLTASGRARLEGRLRSADGPEISDQSRFFVVLAFLSQLPDAAARRAVLQRRLDFLSGARSFFTSDDGAPLPAAQIEDVHRRGMFRIARATRDAEIAWLQEQLAETTDPPLPPPQEQT